MTQVAGRRLIHPPIPAVPLVIDGTKDGLLGSNGLNKSGVVILGRVYPRADRRRHEMRIGVLLERRESFVWRALEPCIAVLECQNRRHTLLGVVNLTH